ncbi:uncharacterized protein LOC114527377 [Dendronephthya gigantea]|uniref:uncharacterized protein LOC114527377 n=1 Tax=Dendronephthya gigantea TaxID=151771 RepID=UPI00106D2374|nr:uncharacterized protein LOC114527377 [Dendronephthya gigantea]
MLANKRWLEGPEFLWKTEHYWPTMIDVPPLVNEDPEVRKEMKIYVTTTNDDCLLKLLQRYSSWWCLKRSVAWLSRYKQFLKMKVHQRKDGVDIMKMKPGYLRLKELKQAEIDIVRYVQSMSFPELVNLEATYHLSDKRSKKKSLKNIKTSLYKLNPLVKDGLLVVGGQLKKAQINEESKHPIILPYKHHVTNLIIQQYHHMVGHMGQESVLASLRERFWFIKGRSAVRQAIRRCIDCQKRKKPPSEQFMADLPRDRYEQRSLELTILGHWR